MATCWTVAPGKVCNHVIHKYVLLAYLCFAHYLKCRSSLLNSSFLPMQFVILALFWGPDLPNNKGVCSVQQLDRQREISTTPGPR